MGKGGLPTRGGGGLPIAYPLRCNHVLLLFCKRCLVALCLLTPCCCLLRVVATTALPTRFVVRLCCGVSFVATYSHLWYGWGVVGGVGGGVTKLTPIQRKFT